MRLLCKTTEIASISTGPALPTPTTSTTTLHCQPRQPALLEKLLLQDSSVHNAVLRPQSCSECFGATAQAHAAKSSMWRGGCKFIFKINRWQSQNYSVPFYELSAREAPQQKHSTGKAQQAGGCFIPLEFNLFLEQRENLAVSSRHIFFSFLERAVSLLLSK